MPRHDDHNNQREQGYENFGSDFEICQETHINSSYLDDRRAAAPDVGQL